MSAHTVTSLEEFNAFARTFADDLLAGTVVGLIGDLGAGKTTFVQQACAALGVIDAVRSPTFVLMQIHPTSGAAKERGVTQVCHVDAYRLEKESDLARIGFTDYAHDPSTVTFVEWADRIPSIKTLPNYREVRIAIGQDQARTIELQTTPSSLRGA